MLTSMVHVNAWKRVLGDGGIDEKQSLCWFDKADIPSRDESLLFAIRSEAVPCLREFRRKCGYGDAGAGRCRWCQKSQETCSHLVSGCPTFSFTRYLERHDRVLRALYWKILGHIGAEREARWWEQQTPPKVFWNGHKLTWNQSFSVRVRGNANRPDMVWEKPDGTTLVIEGSVPKDSRVSVMTVQKREKYVPLVRDLRLRKNGFVDMIPLVIGATGVISKDAVVSLSKQRLGFEVDIGWLQEIATLATIKFFRYTIGAA